MCNLRDVETVALVKVADAAEGVVVDHERSLKRRLVIGGPQGRLSLIGAVVVTKELCGVVVLQRAGELVEELEELCGGLIAELGGQRNQGWMVVGHGVVSWFLRERDQEGRVRGMH